MLQSRQTSRRDSRTCNIFLFPELWAIRTMDPKAAWPRLMSRLRVIRMWLLYVAEADDYNRLIIPARDMGPESLLQL